MAENDEIVLDEGQDEGGATSEVNLNPDKKEEEESDDETPEVDWESDDNPYKKKYTESSTEVQQNLLPKIKEHEGLSAKQQKQAEELQKEVERLTGLLKAEKPEVYDSHQLKKDLDSTKSQLSELLENSSLNDFLNATPLAKEYREALKSHKRANPGQSLEDIWNKFFKEGAEAKAELAKTTSEKKKKNKAETGEGSSTSDLSEKKIGGYTEAEFNKLPVAKRREVLIKIGQLKP